MIDPQICDKKIRRATAISKLNGWSVAGFAGLCALAVLVFGDWFGFMVGVAVALSGFMELRGSRLLGNKNPGAISWLVGSQIYLIAVLWYYASFNLLTFDKSDPWGMFSPGLKDLILGIQPDQYLVEEMLIMTYYATYLSLILVVLIYQGGLCLYYLSRKKYLYPVAE
jgi:hypothetical protein